MRDICTLEIISCALLITDVCIFSRLMMTLGTLLQVVSMLMLSLSRRQKYYQVS